MTEGTHQIACNPLPPRMRKPGSVGLPTGVEITILDEQGNHLPAGVTGEIALRGETIITGYLNNPAANAASFTDGWFRTGDQGYRDLDGYLFITGRLKEIINRGGEKVAPREVEEVLLDYSAVQQAVAFAMPDEQMGEEVAAAVVLRQPGVTEAELRQFAAERLAHFKVPCRILILPDIPKGPTGKIQRVGLAEKLGLTGVEPVFPDRPAAPPVSLAERAIARLWSDLFEKPIENIHARFLDLGGNSILAARLTTSMRQAFNVPVQILDLLDRPTIAEQAAWFESYLTAQIEALSDEEVDRELNANHD
jgi:hypothetical protein